MCVRAHVRISVHIWGWGEGVVISRLILTSGVAGVTGVDLVWIYHFSSVPWCELFD